MGAAFPDHHIWIGVAVCGIGGRLFPMIGLVGTGAHIRADFGATYIEPSGAGEDTVSGWGETMAGRGFLPSSKLSLPEDLF